jgi:hypothetical protein
MSIQANVPVLYLDSYHVEIKCEEEMIQVHTCNETLRLPDNGGVLILLGRYSHMCQNIEYGLVFSKSWYFDRGDVQFEIGDPEKEGVYGDFTIDLNSRHPIVFHI